MPGLHQNTLVASKEHDTRSVTLDTSHTHTNGQYVTSTLLASASPSFIPLLCCHHPLISSLPIAPNHWWRQVPFQSEIRVQKAKTLVGLPMKFSRARDRPNVEDPLCAIGQTPPIVHWILFAR